MSSPEDPKHDTVVVANHDTGMDPFLVAQAQQAAAREKAMPLKQAVPIFWRGMFWSGVLSVALVMEGFDVVQLGAFYAQPAFQKHFGEPTPGGSGSGYYIPANWQSAIGNSGTAGTVLGLIFNAWAQYRYGSKWVYVGAMTLLIGALAFTPFAPSLTVILIGSIFIGFLNGIFQTLTTAYAAELCPMVVRPYLTSWVNVCWTLGALLGSATQNATLNFPGDSAWKTPLYLQWIWPGPLIVAAIFAPESPWHLTRTGKIDEAKKSISRLAYPGYYSEDDLTAQVALMQHTLAIEALEHKDQSFLNCFKGTNLRRTEIVAAVFAVQQWCGQPMTSLSTQLLTSVGLSVTNSFRISLATYGMGLLGTLLMWGGIGRFGRRRIYLVGQAGMALVLGIMGILGFFKTTAIVYTTSAMLIFMNFIFQCTVGPACYTYVAELPAAEVRSPTIVVARGAYILSGLVTGQLTPRMLSTEEWNWGAKCGLFWMGTNILGLIYCYFRMPETKGRTFGELDILFSNNVPARKFASTNVEEFEELNEPISEKEKETGEVQHVEALAS